MNSFRTQHRIQKFPKSFSETVASSIASILKGEMDLPTEEEIERSRRRRAIKAYRAKADVRRTVSERFADWMTAKFGTITFLVLNAAVFVTWLLLNSGKISGLKIFDPYPFVMLTTIVSLEAIFLAIIVLISQNRASRIAEIREEEDLQINVIAEEEVTKIIELLGLLLKKHHINIAKDPEALKMLQPTDRGKIEKNLEEQLL